MAKTKTITPNKIKKGDKLIGVGGWTAVEDAKVLPGGRAMCRVQFPDGGTGSRVWVDLKITFEVERG